MPPSPEAAAVVAGLEPASVAELKPLAAGSAPAFRRGSAKRLATALNSRIQAGGTAAEKSGWLLARRKPSANTPRRSPGSVALSASSVGKIAPRLIPTRVQTVWWGG